MDHTKIVSVDMDYPHQKLSKTGKLILCVSTGGSIHLYLQPKLENIKNELVFNL